MAAKFDKEAVKKHHFWLLLIPTFIGVILAVFGAGCVSDATVEKLKGFENAKASAANVKPIEAAKRQEEQKDKLLLKRQERWSEGWRLQGTDQVKDGKVVERNLFAWPTEIPLTDEERRDIESRKFGADIQTMSSVLTNIRENYKDIYPNLLKSIEPLQVGEKNNWKAVLEHVSAWVERPSEVRDPTSEEAWLAMELYWLQKDFLLALAKVNETAATFTPVTKDQTTALASRFPKAKIEAFDDKNPKKASFENRTWLVTLELVEVEGVPSVRGELTNKTPTIQLLGLQNEMTLLLRLDTNPDSKPTKFVIQASSLAGGQTMPIKFIKELHEIGEGRPTGIYQVKQQFDTRSAPVKLIDRLVLGDSSGGWSSKHAMYVFEQAAFSKAAIEKEAKKKTPMGMMGMGMGAMGTPPTAMMGGPTPMTPIGPSAPGGMMGGSMGTMGGMAAGGTPLTESGLRRERYASITEQVRVIPVGLRLVVDQNYVQDVLVAVAETRTRFQTTQMTWHRYQGTANTVFGSGYGGSGGMGGFPKGGFPVFPKGDGDSGLPMGFPGMGMGSSGTPADDPTLNNLVEVAIYGLSTIYEKYEEKKTPPAPKGMMGTPMGMMGTPMGNMGMPMGMMGTPMNMMGVPPKANMGMPVPMGMMGTPAPMGNMGMPVPMGMMGIPPKANMGTPAPMANMGMPVTPPKS